MRQVLLLIAAAAGDPDYEQKNIALRQDDYISRIKADGEAGAGSASWTALREAIHRTKKYLLGQSKGRLLVPMRLKKEQHALVTNVRIKAFACHAEAFPRRREILMNHLGHRRKTCS